MFSDLVTLLSSPCSTSVIAYVVNAFFFPAPLSSCTESKSTTCTSHEEASAILFQFFAREALKAPRCMSLGRTLLVPKHTLKSDG